MFSHQVEVASKDSGDTGGPRCTDVQEEMIGARLRIESGFSFVEKTACLKDDILL